MSVSEQRLNIFSASRLAVALLIAGIALLMIQYFADAPLWVDELAVTHNVLEKSYVELLTRPLRYDQVAPPFFLIIEKAMIGAFGSGELVVRAYPLVMGIVALVMTWLAARRLLTPSFVLVPVALLAMSRPAIWYATQVKQYSSDAAIAAAIVCLTLVLMRGASRRTAIAIALAGVTFPWFSMPAAFVLAGGGAALIVAQWEKKEYDRKTLLVVIAWGVSTMLALATSRMRVSPETMAFMKSYWAPTFIVLPPTNSEEWRRPAFLLRQMFETMFNGGPDLLYLAIAAVGSWVAWRRAKAIAVLLLAPCVLAMIAAALRAYPFDNRLILFLFPSFFLLTAIGGEQLATLGASVLRSPMSRALRAWPALLGAVLLVPSMVALLQLAPPWRRQPLRDVLSEVATKARPGDAFFVTYGAAQAWRYYASRAGLESHLTRITACRDDAPIGYTREVESLAGRGRVWIIHVPAGNLRDASSVLAAASHIGTPLARIESDDRFFENESAVGAYLFDFARGATADVRHAVGGDVMGTSIDPPAPSCRGAAVVRTTN